MPDLAPELLCRCDCHDEVVEGATSAEQVRLEITVRLDDPLEAAIALQALLHLAPSGPASAEGRMRDVARRRASWRAYQRRKAAKARAQACRARITCPRRFSQQEECGGRLETLVLPGGATTTLCPRCERLKAGICLDCPQPVVGRVGVARRCAEHRRLAGLRHSEEWRQRNLAYVKRANRRRYHEHREEQKAASRRWREAHPEKVREQNVRGTARRRLRRQAARRQQQAVAA